jgi:hypothetical protein
MRTNLNWRIEMKYENTYTAAEARALVLESEELIRERLFHSAMFNIEISAKAGHYNVEHCRLGEVNAEILNDLGYEVIPEGDGLYTISWGLGDSQIMRTALKTYMDGMLNILGNNWLEKLENDKLRAFKVLAEACDRLEQSQVAHAYRQGLKARS